MKDMLEKILEKLKGAQKVVFMGVGEVKLSDDGVGPYIISELINYSNDRFLFINAAADPMSRTEEIINFKPSHFVILDTCTFNAPPGTVAILERENICNYVPISTHTIPVHIVIDFISERLPGLKAFMIGFVPESLEGFRELHFYKEGELTLDDLNEMEDLPFFKLNLSETVKNVADKIVEIIKRIISSN